MFETAEDMRAGGEVLAAMRPHQDPRHSRHGGHMQRQARAPNVAPGRRGSTCSRRSPARRRKTSV